MYCNTCGSNIPDGSTQCNVCGTPIAPPAPRPARPRPTAAGTTTRAPQHHAAPAGKVSKLDYLKTYADPNSKKLGLIALILAVVCLISLFVSMNATLNGPLYDISVVSLALNAEGNRKDFEEELDDMIEDLETELKWMEAKGDLSRSEYKEAKAVVKKLEKNFSINNFKKIGELYAEEDEDIEEILEVINGLSAAAIIFTLVCVGLLALGTVRFAKGWVIFSLVLALIYSLIFSTFLCTLFVAVSFIALIVMMGKFNKAYTSFCHGY